MAKERAYSAKPSITSGEQCRASLPGLALLLSMGAGEAGGGKRDWWGQARPMGAVGGCKPPYATKAIGPNPVPTLWNSIWLPVRDELISVVTAHSVCCYTGIIHPIAVSLHERPLAIEILL